MEERRSVCESVLYWKSVVEVLKRKNYMFRIEESIQIRTSERKGVLYPTDTGFSTKLEGRPRQRVLETFADGVL